MDKRTYRYLIAVVFVLTVSAHQAHAALSVAATPLQGGYDLRFGKVSAQQGSPVSREIGITVTSSGVVQYRLSQVLIEPLRTDQGEQLPQGVFSVYGIRGTNRSGTLHIEQEAPLLTGRMLLYTSNAQGASDSFTLVYSLRQQAEIAPGLYRGRISFTVEPLNESESPSTVSLSISAEVDAVGAVHIATVSGSQEIIVTRGDEEKTPERAEVLVEVTGGFGRQYRIVQRLSDQPVSPEGQLLEAGAVTMNGAGAQKGMVSASAEPLTLAPQVIYTSSLRGEPDTFRIRYAFDDRSQSLAGRYTATLTYSIEFIDTGVVQLCDTLRLHVENPRVFELKVSPEIGGLLQFRALKPGESPQTQEVTIAATSNLGKPYQVSQRTGSLLTNKEGARIPEEYFTLRQEKMQSRGTLPYPERVPVKEGEMSLFTSDGKGSSDSFKIVYSLGVPRDIPRGDYSTNITYSLIEL